MPIIFKRNKMTGSNKNKFYSEKQIDCCVEISRNGNVETTKLAALANDASAIYTLANMYYMGFFVERNIKEAAHLFRKAAELGVWDAQNILVRMTNDAYDVFYFSVIYHATLLTINPILIKQFNLWVKHYPKELIFLLQENPGDSYRMIKSFLRPRALQNKFIELLQEYVMRTFLQLEGRFDHAISKVILQYNFENNIFLELEDRMAPLEIATQNILPGLDYDGVGQEDAIAIRRLNMAAHDGNVEAQLQLGDYYENLSVKKRDLQEAIFWYRKSALEGYAPSQLKLARCYEKNNGIKNSLNESVYWYRLAAEQKEQQAREKLIELYDEKKLSDVLPALTFHAALTIERKDMISALIRLIRANPAKVMLLLQESREGSYQQLKHFIKENQGDRVDDVLVMFASRILMSMNMKLETHSLRLIFSFLYPPSMTKIIFPHIKPIYFKPTDQLHDFYSLCMQMTDNFHVQMRLIYIAAQNGDMRAQFLLGRYYEKNFMLDRDAAMYWYKRAALQGDAESQYHLDVLQGKITHQKIKSSLKNDAKITTNHSDQEFEKHHYQLFAEIKHQDNFVMNEESIMWLRLGAEQKYPSAIDRLGALYLANKNNIMVVYHAAISIQLTEMQEDLNRLTKLNPKKFIGLLRKNPNDSFEVIKHYFDQKIRETIELMLKDPTSHHSTLHRFFGRIFPKLKEDGEEVLQAKPK